MSATQKQEQSETSPVEGGHIYAPRLGYSSSDRDPYIGQCPSWCADGDHRFAFSEDDPTHDGSSHVVALRHVKAEYQPSSEGTANEHTLANLMFTLRQRATHRDPTIEVTFNDNTGIDLTIEEATLIGRGLLELVEQTR